MKAGVWAAVAVIMAGLYGVDRGLAALEAREVASQARHLYQRGVVELNQGHARAALDLLTRAHSLDRDNRAYLLALARAQGQDGRLDDATASLNQLLDADSNDAEANLEMARLLVSDKRYNDAYSYYHRALFGNGMKDPVNVRLELARLLGQEGKNRELLAELLLLERPAEQDPTVAMAVAGMFLRAGAPDRAAQMYRALLRLNPSNRDAESGLGEVELERGDYRSAQIAFTRAHDATKEQLAETLAGLDPTLRRLSSAEKYNRSARVLQMTAAACGQTVDVKPVKKPTNEDAEGLLDQASAMWKSGNCKAQPEDPVAIVQRKIAQ